MTETTSTPERLIAAGDTVALMTGPIVGDVVLADGTVVDVTPQVLDELDPARAYEIAAAIGARLEAEGNHPDAGEEFVHNDTTDTNPYAGPHAGPNTGAPAVTEES